MFSGNVILLLGLLSRAIGGQDSPASATEKLGYFSAPNYRSTLELLWTCLISVFLCCWTAIHPDVPHPKSTWTQQWSDKALCLLLGVVAPEIFVYLAFTEWFIAKAGFAEHPPTISADKWSMTHRLYAQMGGFHVKLRRRTEGDAHEPAYLYIDELYRLLALDQIDSDAFITREQILDKGKADGMLKAFTLLQVLWVAMQSIGRAIQHLSLTTLEISTLAYFPCAIAIITFWWHKPYDVGIPTLITLKPGVEEERARPVAVKQYRIHGMARRCWEEAITSAALPINRNGMPSCAAFFIVGGIHLSAWNFGFPTLAEQWAWRICSLVITFSIPISWILARTLLLASGDGNWPAGKRTRKGVTACQTLGLVTYMLARMYLLVEVFMGLRAVPRDVYATPDWTAFVPHLQ